MSKYLKSLLIAFLVVCMTVCLGIMAVACTDKPDNSDDDKDGDKPTFPSSVSVTVMLDETTPAENVEVQLCALKDAENLGLCLMYVKTNAQGVATISIDEANGKDYEIHLKEATIPSGYNYVNAEGTPYSELNVAEGKVGKGVQFDVTKTASVTITLEAENALKLGVEKTAYVGNSYVFTAPAAGYYLFTCDAPIEGWSLNDAVQDSDSKTIQLDKGATATVAIDFDSTFYGTTSCTLKVENGTAPALGSLDNPLALTVGGDAANFSVNLKETVDKNGDPDENGNMPTKLYWGIDGYYATFTTDKAGAYKFIFTFGEGDDLDISASAGDSYAGFSDFGSTNNGGYLVYNEFKADTTYLVKITPTEGVVNDYADIVTAGTTSLNYSVKVEYVDGSEPSEDSHTLTLALGNNTYTIDEDFEWGPTYVCTFVGEANTTYTVTINSDNTLNSTPGATINLTTDENGVITFNAGAGFDDTQVIINISLANAD